MTTATKPPTKVFISYSHDNEEHVQRVRALADRLREDGLDIILDLYDPHPKEPWPLWMEKNLDAARFVLMICTATYLRRVMWQEEVGVGLGVQWEGNHIFSRIYESPSQAYRFIPVLLQGGKRAHIPTPVSKFTRYHVKKYNFSDAHYRALYFHLSEESDPNSNTVVPLSLDDGPISTEQSSPEIPSLLPYLADRNDQVDQLSEVWEESVTSSSRPLVCLVHGDEIQCHDTFRLRLQEVVLPVIAGIDSEKYAVKPYALDWPESLQDMSKLPEKLRRNLAKSVLNRPTATLDELQKALALHPSPVVIHSHLLTEDWQRQGSGAIDSFLRFWNDWPDLSEGQKIIVLLFVKYQVTPPGFVKRLRYRSLNKKIGKSIENFQWTDGRVVWTILPRLDGVRRGQVDSWARSEPVAKFRDPEAMITDIRKMYHKWELKTSSDAIPMEALAPQLMALLLNEVPVTGGTNG